MIDARILFSDRSASALGDALQQSASFRAAAGRWEDAVVLEWSDAPKSALASDAMFCGVYLSLHGGDCRVARVATADDYEHARIVMSADLETWNSLLAGEMTPTMALLWGRLKLTKGTMAALIPHAGAASEVVRVAQSVVMHDHE